MRIAPALFSPPYHILNLLSSGSLMTQGDQRFRESKSAGVALGLMTGFPRNFVQDVGGVTGPMAAVAMPIRCVPPTALRPTYHIRTVDPSSRAPHILTPAASHAPAA